MDIRAPSTQLGGRGGVKVVWYSRMDMGEGGVRSLKETVGEKVEHNLEYACEGGGCLAALPVSHDGTDLSRLYFRYAL